MLWPVTASPDIFNTDQGSQFTGAAFTGVLADNGIAISMDGKGAWRDNVFVERLWRSVKYEEVYLRAYETVGEARHSIGRYLDFYNGRRPHSSLDDMHPGSSLLQPAATPHGGLTPAEAPLIDAENLFRQPGPAHSVSIGILAISALPALAADRPVTEDERGKLVAADGKKYDIKFDPQMKLKRKNLD